MDKDRKLRVEQRYQGFRMWVCQQVLRSLVERKTLLMKPQILVADSWVAVVRLRLPQIGVEALLRMDSRGKACEFARICDSQVGLHRTVDKLVLYCEQRPAKYTLILRFRHNAQPVLDLPELPMSSSPRFIFWKVVLLRKF